MMDARELPVTSGLDAARVVRALGQHRYVGGRLVLVHAFVFAALDDVPELSATAAWARGVLADRSIDAASKDERLWRAATEAELAHALAVFWGTGDARERAHARLRELLRAAEVEPSGGAPFDETREDEVFPVLVDAGWELLPLGQLDPERHKGAIAAFGEPILFEAARFEEENDVDTRAYLQELPALGAAELLDGCSAQGELVEPLTLWTSGPDAYHDYVLRGVLRAAKIGGGAA